MGHFVNEVYRIPKSAVEDENDFQQLATYNNITDLLPKISKYTRFNNSSNVQPQELYEVLQAKLHYYQELICEWAPCIVNHEKCSVIIMEILNVIGELPYPKHAALVGYFKYLIEGKNEIEKVLKTLKANSTNKFFFNHLVYTALTLDSYPLSEAVREELINNVFNPRSLNWENVKRDIRGNIYLLNEPTNWEKINLEKQISKYTREIKQAIEDTHNLRAKYKIHGRNIIIFNKLFSNKTYLQEVDSFPTKKFAYTNETDPNYKKKFVDLSKGQRKLIAELLGEFYIQPARLNNERGNITRGFSQSVDPLLPYPLMTKIDTFSKAVGDFIACDLSIKEIEQIFKSPILKNVYPEQIEHLKYTFIYQSNENKTVIFEPSCNEIPGSETIVNKSLELEAIQTADRFSYFTSPPFSPSGYPPFEDFSPSGYPPSEENINSAEEATTKSLPFSVYPLLSASSSMSSRKTTDHSIALPSSPFNSRDRFNYSTPSIFTNTTIRPYNHSQFESQANSFSSVSKLLGLGVGVVLGAGVIWVAILGYRAERRYKAQQKVQQSRNLEMRPPSSGQPLETIEENLQIEESVGNKNQEDLEAKKPLKDDPFIIENIPSTLRQERS